MISKKLKEFLNYPFDEVEKAKIKAVKKGFKIIDLGVGDPKDSLFKGAIEGLKKGIIKHARSGYPSYIGMKKLRKEISEWIKRKFDVKINYEKNVLVTSGSKEAIFHFPLTFINEKDYVLIPSIGYPPYKTGTIFSGGKPIYYNLKEKNEFNIDINEIENLLKKYRKIKIIWINFPNNPTTKILNEKKYYELIEISKKYNIIIASDEAYIDIYKDKKPKSILEFTNNFEKTIAFFSLSKRSNAANLRIGFVVGGEKIIKYFSLLKTQIDSGVSNIIQEAAVEALKDEEHVKEIRKEYNRRREILASSLNRIKIKFWSEATIYVWAKINQDSLEFSKKMLEIDKERKIGINVTPGKFLSLKNENEARNYIRFALVQDLEKIKLVSEILKKYEN